ncbi:MAG: EAL domain-containing protein [Chloroflexi bacterium]|nr:EAL domain-containing protein [Chloroflexota bacterium]
MLNTISSVRGRIIIGFSFLVLILVAVAAGSAWQVREHRSDTAAMEEHADTAFVLQNALVNAEAAASGLQRYVMIGGETAVAGDEELLPEIRSDMAEVVEGLAQAIADTEARGDREQAARLYQISAEAASLVTGVEVIISLQQSGDAQAAAAGLEVAVLPFREFESKFEEAAEVELQAVSALRSRADRAGDLALWLLIISGAAGAALGLATSVFVARSIIKPLSALEEAAVAVSQGDLEARAQTTGPRELARLGSALNQMTESLLDASKRRELEESLKESEERFRTLAESGFEGIVISDGGKILEANESFARMFGYESAEVIGLSPLEMTTPESAELIAKNIQSGFERPYEITGVRKDGKAFDMEVVGKGCLYKGHNARITAFRDITARKRAEEALRESETKFRTLAETSAAAIFIDQGTRFMFVNSALEVITGYSREELLAMHLLDVIHPDFRELVKDQGEARLRGEQVSPRYEIKILTKSGEERWVDVTTGLIEFEGKPSVLGTAFDVTERKQAEEALGRLSRQNELLLNSAGEGIYGLDLEGKTTFVNPAAARMIGWEVEELIGKPQHDILHHSKPDGSPYPRESCPIYAALNDGSVHHVDDEVFWRRDGTSFPVEYASTPILDERGELAGAVVTFRDITERKQAEETIKHLAYHDALTNLANRTMFEDRLVVTLAQARRKRRMAAVMFLDLDQFKVVNDTVGHALGDRLLQSVAERLTGLVRDGDTVARVGGDEFTLLLAEVERVEEVAEVAERVLDALRQPWVLNGHEFRITTSIGIAMFPSDGEDADSLLSNADTAMYRAKDQGRDNYKLYTPAMNARIVERLALENSLRHGLERGEFLVYYQPQVDIASGKIVGMEALVRWQHPERGLVFPAEFIPVAEETGLIVPLGEWVLRTACAQNKAWQEAGFPPMRMAVNLSARQFQQRDLIEEVDEVLKETGLEARWLQLEITEGVAMQDVESNIAVLRKLREMGVQIAIDDFGTGHSSLSYLSRLPIDVIKIDQSFVQDMTTDPNDAAIARSIIVMAHNLKLKVIAEGVETEEQLAFLKKRRCDEMQGYLFSKPAPAEAFEEMLKQSGRTPRARRPVEASR